MTESTEQPTPEQRLARLAGVVANSEDAIFSVNASGAVTSWNRAAARLYGIAAEAALGTPAVALAAPDRVAEQRALLERVFAGEHVSRHEIEHRRSDGLPVTVSLSAWPVFAEGRTVEVSVIARDVTEQRLEQATLAESEARRREIEQLAEIGSWTWDAASSVVQWSAGLHAIASLDPQEFEGTLDAHLAVVHPADVGTVASAMRRSLDQGTRFEEEFRIVRPSGEERWIVGRGEPVRNRDLVVALRGIYQDVTARRAAERLKDEFLATVSHELRTPLTLIVGFSNMLSRGASPELEQVVSALMRNAAEMEHMVTRLLDFSHLEADREYVDFEVVDARAVIEASLAAIRFGVEKHRIVNDVDEGELVRCDLHSVARIIENLVNNAAKYSPAGTTIQVTARVDGEWLVVSVADEGSGLPEEIRSRVFDRFFQGPGQPPERRGTGIGLAIVTRSVELHGGTVWCEDRPTGGATFSFTLPRASC